ncbi:hypothetical protein HX92_3670 [Mycobacterium tuberculosis]|uniref:Uncharacterized protein n=1 Tax=Mycobacterium tuberculosis (strain CDC 1551 / Oshkosh) TaxID=83331 RepID=Q8VJI7_MYCTO|nr:hypothetical protein MT2514 [Mycobacterium tuberculosis CDC1551]AOZ43710.1 hypothetical protein BTB1458_2711 [Mycobacterium tuberculosis]EQM20565.1 hypothetical protein FJ05194_2126 [Mycobacterium tuberculosis FJ05194]CDM10811.1 hypothetical protein MT49_2672 [Mycobacterium tuberculosis 49-02]BAQ06544.1 hypothetical protein KURONO_2752 [Mycobacterium tuberculosis str. Kurono]
MAAEQSHDDPLVHLGYPLGRNAQLAAMLIEIIWGTPHLGAIW